MDQECPTGAAVLEGFIKRDAERKGRPSINALDTVRSPGARSGKGSAGPSSKSNKQSREGGNIATTTRSLGSLPPPPPRREAIEVDSLSPKQAEKAIAPQEAGRSTTVSMSPLAILGVTCSSLGGCALHSLKPLERLSGSSPHRIC